VKPNIPKEDNGLPYLDNSQIAILNGLKEIGEEIASLYYDGIKIFNSELKSKSYLLAHIAREIEGGIRDIFVSGMKREVQKCSECGSIKQSISHIDEICKVLDVNKEDEFAKEWHKIAVEFHKYAHRHGPWKTPRDENEFNALWKRFEKILHYLVGDYIKLTSLVDKVLKYEVPTEEILGTLGNLLRNEARKRYFFKKLHSIHWLKSLFELGYFRPECAPSPKPAEEEGYFVIPEWDVLPYLERVSQQVNEPPNEKYIDELLKFIQEVNDYHIRHGKALDNYRTWWYFVKILLNIPKEKISIEIIELIPIWLDSKFDTMVQGADIATKLLPKFLLNSTTLEDIQKAEKIINSITAIKTFQLSAERAKLLGKQEEEKLVIDPYWLKEIFEKYSEIIGEKCSVKVIEDLANNIRILLKREEEGTYKSLYEESEYPIDDPLEMLSFILKRILIAKEKSDINTTKAILRSFLKDKYLYFPKMALYVIGQNTDKYRELFWEILDTDIGDIIMEKTLYLGDELKRLLANLNNLTDTQRESLNGKIENAVKRHDFKEDRERYIALYKQEIYEALSHDSYFKNLYEEMKGITKVDAALHPAIGKVETRWIGPGLSPFTKEEIMKMPNDKLAEIFATFKTKDPWKGPTVGGLADLIAEVAKENPENFIEELNPFKDTGFIYVYEILKGIRESWDGKKNIDWNKVFEFAQQYIDRTEFWEDKFIVEKGKWLGGADHQWIAGIVAELIQDGTRDDTWAFSEEYFEKAEKIIFLILDNLKAEEDKEITDYVTYTLNTPFGKALTALILLALRIARKKGIKDDIKWAPKYREKYNEILSKQIIEGFTNLGRYMPNFYYLDKEWVKEEIKSIDNEKGSKYWEAFINGYLSIGRVYDDLYNLMRPHYQYGIDYDFKEKRDNEHLIQHISLAYLRGHESIEKPESLFNQIINRFKYEHIKEIISFFWMQRFYLRISSEENKKMIEKVLEFWRYLYEKYKGKDKASLTKEDKQILSSVSKLGIILPLIDAESYEWLMVSASYVHKNFNSPFFIEYLDGLKDKGGKSETAKYIGDIYLKMLEKITPDFDQKHIRSIIEFLYNAGAMDSANKICNIYDSRGFEFLRDIYEKYNVK
jgi:hypothetical protein